MSDPESNKIFAAILIAGIVAMLGGFIAKLLVHPKEPAKDAVPIEGEVVAATGIPQKPEKPKPILHLIATAEVARGEKLSRACAACHSFNKGGPNKVGPNLWGTVGAEKGHIKGFAYSDALMAKGGEWTYLALNKFLWKPKEYIPGTKMNYIGLKKPEDRAAMVAWLRTLADTPQPLPGEAQIAAEKEELAPPEPEPVDEPTEEPADDVPELTDEPVDEEIDPAVAGEIEDNESGP